MNASDIYWLPSISPLFSSLTIVLGVGGLFLIVGGDISTPEYIKLGSIILAGTTLLGGVWQWLAQQLAQMKSGISRLRLRFDFKREGVSDVMKVMAPATLSSGMLHINVYTDLYFASYIASAAAAMRYANFIVLTPLGIISNMILVPFLPVFSRLASPENWDELKDRIRQGLILTALTMLPLTAIFIALANPIVTLIYQRGVFQASDSAVVAPVLLAYGLGMFFYLGRDVLVRVFYALGDGNTPFKISIFNIFLNVILDYFLVEQFATQGLVFATIGVNVVSMVIMVYILHRRLRGFPLRKWGTILAGLIMATIVAGFACSSSYQLVFSWWGADNFILQLVDLGVASGIAIVLFFGISWQLKLPELNLLTDKIKAKIAR